MSVYFTPRAISVLKSSWIVAGVGWLIVGAALIWGADAARVPMMFATAFTFWAFVATAVIFFNTAVKTRTGDGS